MKILMTITLFSSAALATCFMTRTVCTPQNNFQNIYEIREATCSPPGGPVNTTKSLNIKNKMSDNNFLINKDFNFTRNNYFQAKIINAGKINYLKIDDRSLPTDNNINISTERGSPLELNGYTCKNMIQ